MTVTPAVLTSIVVTPTESLYRQWHHCATYRDRNLFGRDTQDLTSSASWTSSACEPGNG